MLASVASIRAKQRLCNLDLYLQEVAVVTHAQMGLIVLLRLNE
jgi:hypothetical protein